MLFSRRTHCGLGGRRNNGASLSSNSNTKMGSCTARTYQTPTPSSLSFFISPQYSIYPRSLFPFQSSFISLRYPHFNPPPCHPRNYAPSSSKSDISFLSCRLDLAQRSHPTRRCCSPSTTPPTSHHRLRPKTATSMIGTMSGTPSRQPRSLPTQYPSAVR